MALQITRLKPEEDYTMRNILVSKYRYYIDPSTGKVYKRGDADMPPGVRLLVAEGSPVQPDVADEYELETEDAQDVARVPAGATTAPADRSLGVSRQAEAGYRRIEETADVQRSVAPLIERSGQHGAGSAAQIGLMAETTIAQRMREVEDEERPGDGAKLSSQQTGLGTLPAEESARLTRQLEEGERDALARHKATIDQRAEEIKEEIKEEGSPSASTSGAVRKGILSDDDSPAPATSRRSREINPAGSKGGKKGGAKGGSSKGSTAR